MIYDLTTLLSTIAATSASFVAILGGFIASKLISISSDRNGVIKRLQDIDEEISYRNAVLNNAREQNNQEDALYFILDNIEALIDDNELERVYDEEKPNIELYDLAPFW